MTAPWPQVPLGETAEIVSGITKGRRPNGEPLRRVPYLAVANVQDRQLHLTSVKSIEATEAEVERYRLLPGDLLLTEGGDPDKLGRGTVWSGELPECIHQNHIFRVRIHDPGLLPQFVSRLIASNRGRRYFLRSAKQTTGIASINKRQLAAFPVLRPPVNDQHRIISILDALDDLRCKRRESLTLVDSFTKSLFRDMFGDPATNSLGWTYVPFADIADDMRLGTSTKSGTAGHPVLRIPNVKGGSIDLSDVVRVPANARDIDRLRLADGDLLFVRSNGNPNYVGRCAVFHTEDLDESSREEWGTEFLFASYLIRVRLDRKRAEPTYIQAFMQSPAGRRQLRDASRTSAGQYNINSVGLSGIKIPLPPVDLQEQFTAKKAIVAPRAKDYGAHLTALDELLASLQERAFRGEL